MVYGASRLIGGEASFLWLLATFAVYMTLQLSVTVGCHRLFAHNTFRCHRAWHWLFAIISTLTFHGSPISWVHVHHSHHKHSDTEKDPHIPSFLFLMVRIYRSVNGTFNRAVSHMMNDPMHRYVHQYGVLLCLLVMGALILVNTNLVLFAYLIPCAAYFLSSAVHQIFSHWNHTPRNIGYMEFILPMGEWNHADHHADPGKWDFGKFDLGSYLIRGIKQ
jgi:fatty-acid desaturase